MMVDWISDIGSALSDVGRNHGNAVVAVIATVIGAGWFWQGLARAAEVRREGYATAMRTLVGFQEFPYRIRRRTSDAPELLAELAGRGHDMQEQLGYWQLWADTEHPVVGEVFRETSGAVRGCIKPHVVDAWNRPHVDGPAGMIIATDDEPIPYDLSACAEPLRRLQKVSAWRFGWRRLVSPVWLPLAYGSSFTGLRRLAGKVRPRSKARVGE